MTAPSFVASDKLQFGAAGRKSIEGVLTVPTSGSGGTALTAYTGGTFPQLRGLKRLEFLDAKFSSGHTPSFTEADLKIHGHKATASSATSKPVTDLFPDTLGGVFANHLTDQASEGVNAHYVLAATAGNDATLTGAGVTAGLTNPQYPRNLNLGLSSVGGATAIAGNVIVTGTDVNDAVLTETVAIIPGAIAAGKFRNRVLLKPFKTVTNVFLNTAQPADILVSIGLGTKLALSTPLATPASGDVKKVQKNTARVASTTYVVDTTYNAVDAGADLADNDELYVEYAAAIAGAAGLIDTEASASTNLGTVRCRAIGW